MPSTISLPLLAVLLLLPGLLAAAEPSDRPFPRIEAGQHTAPINRIGVDAEGRWLVTASDDKSARVWDLTDGRLLRVLRPPIGEHNLGKLNAVALSPDGATIALGGWTSPVGFTDSIYIFDRTSGELRRRISGLPNVILHLAFSPDGERLTAALGGGEGIRVYRSDDWTESGRDTDYGAASYWVAFDHDGRLASSSYDGYIRLYDRSLKLIAKRRAPGGQRPFGLAFSPDDRRIAVGFSDTTAVNLLSGEDLSLRHVPNTAGVNNGSLNALAWSRDGRTLFAGGRYYIGNYDIALVSWSEAGHGPARKRPVATDALMNLHPLTDGRLLFGSQDPAWGLLDPMGAPLLGRGPAAADFRRRSHALHLSDDGQVAEIDFKVLDAERRWRVHRLRLDLAQRRLELDPGNDGKQLQRRLQALGHDPGAIDGLLGPRSRAALRAYQADHGLPESGETDPATRRTVGLPRLAGPRTRAPGLTIEQWDNQYEPTLDDKPLELKPFETSHCLDIAADGRHFLLGTSWYLRLFARDGRLIWKTSAPSNTWMVKLSGDGRWAVAAFGDGSVRWFDATNGKEHLALFVDGAAIAAMENGKEGPTTPPWVLWTPEGFFDSAAAGASLMGWHLNRGADRAGELVGADQIGELFRRPDLIARALEPDYPQLARATLADIGDLRQLLATARPPSLERIGPEKVTQAGRHFSARFKVKERGGGVGRIEYWVDGTQVGQGDLRGRFGLGMPGLQEESRPFTLEKGRYKIEARAFDAAGKLASKPVSWALEITGESDTQPALYGVAVGIGPYRDLNLRLNYADDDARAFATALERAGRDLFREVEIRPVIDGEATLEGITTAFETMAAKAGPEDVFVLYLAGHGLALEGRYHFIPQDLRWTDSEAIRRDSLHEDRLRDLLAGVEARKSLVVLDTCHSGAAVGGRLLLAGLRRGGDYLETKAAVDRLKAKTGRAILAASSDRQFALEGFEGHGLFTWVLLEGLRGRADLMGNGDRSIDVSELADYLEEEVPRMSRKRWRYEMIPTRDLQGHSFPIGLRGGDR